MRRLWGASAVCAAGLWYGAVLIKCAALVWQTQAVHDWVVCAVAGGLTVSGVCMMVMGVGLAEQVASTKRRG